MQAVRARRSEVVKSNAVLPAALPKTPVYKFTEADRRQIQKDLCSPSAVTRVRALNALKNPKKRYSMFDVSHKPAIEITPEEVAKPKTLQEVMKDVVAYVEVQSGHDDRSEGIKRVMRAIGAQVNDTLRKNTTHVIFKGGLCSTYQKAKKLGIPIVSILWVEACKKHLILAYPGDYPISDLDRYEHPEIYGPVRRLKAMQPKLDEKEKTGDVEALSKPLVFHTPIANKIRKDLDEISARFRRTEEETEETEKTEEAEATPEHVPLLPKVKCVTEPPAPKPRKSFSLELFTQALKNAEALTKSPQDEYKTSKGFDCTEIVTPKPVANPAKRRTLFNPNFMSEEINLASAKNEVATGVFSSATKICETSFTTPKTAPAEATKNNRRRTLFNPDPVPVATLITPQNTSGTKRRSTALTPAISKTIKVDPKISKAVKVTQKFNLASKENTPPSVRRANLGGLSKIVTPMTPRRTLIRKI